MFQEGIDQIGSDVASPLVGEVLQNTPVEVPELAPRFGAVRLPSVVRQFPEGDSVEGSGRKVDPHGDFSLAFGEDILRAFADRCLVLSRTSPPCSSW